MIDLYVVIVLVQLVLWIALYNHVNQYRYAGIDKNQFSTKFSNWLYRISFIAPFCWFCDNHETTRSIEMDEKLVEAELSKFFNARSFQTLKTLVLFGTVLLTGLYLEFEYRREYIINSIFKINFKYAEVFVGGSESSKYIISCFLLCLAFVPNIVLKKNLRKASAMSKRDIPILQLFIILMLRSKKPVKEIIYVLSKFNSRYKHVFMKAITKYVANPSDGLDYIYKNIPDSGFRTTIDVLRDSGEYAKETTISMLNNSMRQVIEANNSARRRGDITKMALSQSTLAFPFVAVIALGAMPIAAYGLSMLRNAIF